MTMLQSLLADGIVSLRCTRTNETKGRVPKKMFLGARRIATRKTSSAVLTATIWGSLRRDHEII